MSPLRGASPLVSAGERPPRLVLLFAVLTALGIAAAGAVILIVVRHADTAQVQRQAIDRARFATQAVLRPELRAVDLSARPAGKRKQELDRLFSNRVLLQGVSGATLYGPNGRASYTTAAAGSAGRGARAHVLDALDGAVVSEVAVSESGERVLRTYVPLGVTGDKVGGVVRIDQDYSAIEGSVRRFSWLIAGVLEALLVVLCLIFVPVLARVASRIRRHVGELERIATHDEVTGLPNRVGFGRAAEAMLAGSGSGALLLLDVDGFSEVNDTLGAHCGDALLAEVADRLQFELDDCHLLARFGDDEFGVLLTEAEQADVAAIADRVAIALATPVIVDGVRIGASVSIGAALTEYGVEYETILRRASTALSIAKESGQAGVHICGPEVDLRDVSHLAVVSELRDALARGELLVHYQPQSDLTTRRVRGVEALLRWEHPHDGLLTASTFIEYAERSGMAGEIRRLVLESAATQLREWNALGLDLELAVNLGPVDLLDVSLPDEIESLIDRHRIPPWRLMLEITERTLIADERRAHRVIDRLADLGVRLAIDDFGTGYSSLASLRKFPVQQIKLDRCLLEGVPGDAGAEAIIGGCVEIAHGVGATVVAEGIETPDQWRFVSLMGCDIAQGYLVGRPVPADELTPLLDAPNHVPLTAV